MNVEFSRQAYREREWWKRHDRRVHGKIDELLRDIAKSPFSGLGKPELLRGNLSGWWSRRITGEHRLVYQIRAGTIFVAQCRYHYD